LWINDQSTLTKQKHKKEETKMRKVFLLGIVFSLVFAFGPLAMAKSHPQYTCAPTNLTVGSSLPVVDDIEPLEICFDWDWGCGGTPTKYSIDVELLVDGEDWDDPAAVIQKLTFSTGDRTDGEALNATFLCVPVGAFVYWDGDSYEPFTGTARAKVKALGKGSRWTTQNNAFSNWSDDFEIGFVVDDVGSGL
jgi:hypothetical protein